MNPNNCYQRTKPFGRDDDLVDHVPLERRNFAGVRCIPRENIISRERIDLGKKASRSAASWLRKPALCR